MRRQNVRSWFWNIVGTFPPLILGVLFTFLSQVENEPTWLRVIFSAAVAALAAVAVLSLFRGVAITDEFLVVRSFVRVQKIPWDVIRRARPATFHVQGYSPAIIRVRELPVLQIRHADGTSAEIWLWPLSGYNAGAAKRYVDTINEAIRDHRTGVAAG